jgi:hypothetical protein
MTAVHGFGPRRGADQPRPNGLHDGHPMEKFDIICLVSCVWPKRATAALAKDLYRSTWFLKARACAESASSYWFILSAEYGLVHPDAMIEPYEMTLDTMGVAERRNWSRRVQQQMDERMPDANRIMVLAGQRYREFLMDYLAGRAATVHVPMAGMRNGQQLSWLGGHTGDEPAH